MGLYDRDYGRPDETYGQPGIHLGGPRTLTTNLVLITFGVYVVQIMTEGWFTNLFSLHGDTLSRPWLSFQFLTYGFLHAPNDIKHILFNMFGLWFFGRFVESQYGRREYLAYYLIAIIFAGASWYLCEFLANRAQVPFIMLGASGGLSAVLILFALNNPHRTLALFGLFPLPAWLLAVLIVVQDLFGAISRTSNVAFTAHLGGALFAYLYFRNRWKFSNWIPQGWSLPRLRTGPKLRIHDPQDRESKTEQAVDRILQKIQEKGQDSLTWSERRTLEKASKEYRDKK